MNYFNYFTEIEELFIRRRGRNLLLSPLDWALIEAWKQRGIPLHVTLRAIETVFDGFDKNTRSKPKIKSLMYCREEVEAQYKDWLETQIGKAETEKDAPTSKHAEAQIESPPTEDNRQSVTNKEQNPQADETSLFFSKLRENLQKVEIRNGLREAISETIAALENLERENASAPIDLENLEKSLTEIEQNLDNFLLEHTEKSRLEIVVQEIEKTLRPYKPRMATEIYIQTRRNLLLKRLREDLQIPRIGLFYPS